MAASDTVRDIRKTLLINRSATQCRRAFPRYTNISLLRFNFFIPNNAYINTIFIFNLMFISKSVNNNIINISNVFRSRGSFNSVSTYSIVNRELRIKTFCHSFIQFKFIIHLKFLSHKVSIIYNYSNKKGCLFSTVLNFFILNIIL